jgi:hypothetical protein
MTLTARTSLVDRPTPVGAAEPLLEMVRQHQRKRCRTVLIPALTLVLLAAGLIFSFGLKADGAASSTATNLQDRTVALVSGYSVTAGPSSTTSSTDSSHPVFIGAVSLSSKSLSDAAHYLLGQVNPAASHHDLKSATVNNKGGHPTTHAAFTQVGTERWDVRASSNFHKDDAIILGVRVISVPVVEPQNTGLENPTPPLETLGGSLIAAEAHQFASSL